MRKTEQYQLNLWDAEDQVVRADFNADNEKTEAALAALAESVEETAASIAKCAHIATGTYTGTGKSGSANPQKLTFDFKPKFLMVWGYAQYDMRVVEGQKAVIHPGSSGDPTIEQTNTTWGSNYVSWYNDQYGTNTSYGFSQMNTKDIVYSYVAIG